MPNGRQQKMEPRINIVTLGVKNLERAVHFYKDGLGWPLSSISGGDFALFKISTGTALALFPRHLLAKDAYVEDLGGFGGITLQDISLILTAIHGRWHGLRFLNFGKENWHCLISGQIFMNRKQ